MYEGCSESTYSDTEMELFGRNLIFLEESFIKLIFGQLANRMKNKPKEFMYLKILLTNKYEEVN